MTDVASVDDSTDSDTANEADYPPVVYLGDVTDTDETFEQLFSGWEAGDVGPVDGMKRRRK